MTVVDAGSVKALDLRVEVPVEDMARVAEVELVPSGAGRAGAAPAAASGRPCTRSS